MGSVLIINAAPIVRVGLRALLNGMGVASAIHEASSVEEALECVATGLILIIIDPEIPDTNLPEFMRQLRVQHGHASLLFFGGRSSSVFVPLAIRLGADGYLHKSSDQSTIVATINTLLDGMQCFPRSQGISPLLSKLQMLSPKEMEVLLLLRQGLRNKDIARKLFLSEKTISAHKRNLLLKLDIQIIAQLTEHDLSADYIKKTL
ncbi:MAG: response regulator transcription factor [Burkholderiaceae bacterium]|nr:response regulator transcription factor [Burkholderiaceae bacterium]